ncbi:MAG TPA: penicillin acylase family protein [Longimicrobiales bacterium]|nr:penicillin acylase family protein [Longimicrobiales bacterium]
MIRGPGRLVSARGLGILGAGLALLLHTAPSGAQSLPDAEVLTLPGLQRPVEILKDRWGIAHIYAGTEHDLFFAQGFSAARDRLFQFEVWRRQATGTVAEVLGERELERDMGVRLFRYRGDLERELRHYHPRGVEIIQAFVDGINAYVAMAREDPSLLSVEFEMLGIQPGFWTPEVVISRHQGLLSNIGAELRYGRAVAQAGEEAVRAVTDFGPKRPELALDPAIDRKHLLETDILRLYTAFRGGIDFRPEDVAPAYRMPREEDAAQGPAGRREGIDAGLQELNLQALAASRLAGWDPSTGASDPAAPGPVQADARDLGSNNWVVAGSRSASGYPLMANDPHRVQAAPSLRYWVHLVGPGWNVIGGGEPVLPGVSIGHNEHGAWGLTVFATDTEDLYVYELHPDDPDLYRYRDGWERMRVVLDTIPVKGRAPEVVAYRYTRHGPVVSHHPGERVAYAVRAAWMEPGGAPYLASLRMDQARNWEEFVEACTWSNIPGENMVWAGRDGTIGWQAVGIAPIRRNFSGLVPVAGDGRYEWDGYLPMRAKPHLVNPPEGYFASANNQLTPPDYRFFDAIGFEWSDPWRWLRAVEVLGSGTRFTLLDMAALQTDELSVMARTLVPLLEPLQGDTRAVEDARRRLVAWDRVLDRGSVAAGIYAAWRDAVDEAVNGISVPEAVKPWIRSASSRKVVEWLMAPDGRFGADPVAGRDALLMTALGEAVEGLSLRFGPDPEAWVYGQEGYKHIRLRHPLSRAVNDEWRARLEVGPLPRGGDGSTLNQTGFGDNQTSGASFRILVDTGDWDTTLGMNNPGQGGHPDHPHYADLFELWAQDRFHPVFYSREKVESVTGERLELRPGR